MSLEDLKEELSKVVEPGDMVPRDYEKDGCLLEIKARAEQVEAVANGLLSLGVKANERVAVYLPKQPETVFSLFGAAVGYGLMAMAGSMTAPMAIVTAYRMLLTACPAISVMRMIPIAMVFPTSTKA